MNCQDEYLKRLVALAEELKNIQDDKGGYALNKYDLIRSKTNHLIGYILASKELIGLTPTPKGLTNKK